MVREKGAFVLGKAHPHTHFRYSLRLVDCPPMMIKCRNHYWQHFWTWWILHGERNQGDHTPG